jgi:hypothetical protein
MFKLQRTYNTANRLNFNLREMIFISGYMLRFNHWEKRTFPMLIIQKVYFCSQ